MTDNGPHGQDLENAVFHAEVVIDSEQENVLEKNREEKIVKDITEMQNIVKQEKPAHVSLCKLKFNQIVTQKINDNMMLYSRLNTKLV